MADLKALYLRMSELTAPECATVCRIPHSCCDPMYCELTTDIAKERGVTLEPTGHPTLRYMGPNGCIVEPYFRPLCTLHTCEINSFGFKRGDEKWTRRYFKLREEIEAEEWNQQ